MELVKINFDKSQRPDNDHTDGDDCDAIMFFSCGAILRCKIPASKAFHIENDMPKVEIYWLNKY